MSDVIIIGGGPAGVTAALRARELGAEVTLVEKGRLGGTCVNDGVVPTRVWARAARLRRDFELLSTMAGWLSRRSWTTPACSPAPSRWSTRCTKRNSSSPTWKAPA